MNRFNAATLIFGTKAVRGFNSPFDSRKGIAALALLAAGALLPGCGGVGLDEGGDAEEAAGQVDAALTEAACNTVTPPDAYMLDRNFPAPGTSKSFTTPATYGRPTCTKAHILDVYKPAGRHDIRLTSLWAGPRPTTQAACQAARLSTRSADSISTLIAPITIGATWTGTTCLLPSIVDAYTNFQGRLRLLTQGLNAAGATVPVKITITNPN